ncbi:MAG: peptidylprolyl isomerase [Luteolibacter sp.]
MKPILLLIALACPLHAELLAHFMTSQGEVVAELQYDKVPQMVANFVTLAEGTRAWVDPATGAVRKAPYYNGTKFHRTASNGVDEFAQGGSRLGDGSDGPGYTLKDQFDPTLLHLPYALSMGNAGPNTNGAGFFLTGNVSVPSYDGSYTLFGYVRTAASRAVVDAIIAAGPNGTMLGTVTIERTDPAALAFNEQAYSLLVVTQPAGGLSVTRNVEARWNLKQPITTGNILRAFRSTTLAQNSWSELDAAYIHVGVTPPLLTPVAMATVLENASAPSAFYQISLAYHPDSSTPSHLSNRTVLLDLGGATIAYAHVSSGSGGTATYTPDGGAPATFLFNTLDFQSSGHAFTFIVENVGISPRYFLIKLGCDSMNNTQIEGRHYTLASSNLSGWQYFHAGAAAVSR